MTDIIQHAKKALEGATPGPWKISGEFDPEYLELHGAPQEKGSFVYTPILCENVLAHLLPRDVELITAAPELAQALAEEEYQYGVTYIGVNHGGHHIEWVESTGDAELDEDRLQIVVKGWKQMGQSPKVVRRRVSQPEVISEEL